MTFVDVRGVFHDSLRALCWCLAQGVRILNRQLRLAEVLGGRIWLFGNGVRVRRGSSPIFCCSRLGQLHTAESESVPKPIPLVYLFRTIYMCFFPREIHVSVTRPNQGMPYL